MSNLALARALASKFKSNWPLPIKYLGGGVNGRVYETNNGRLMKFIYDNAPQEFKSLQKLQGTYVVPRFRNGNGMVRTLNNKTSKEVQKYMFPYSNNSRRLTAFVMGRAGNSHSMTLYKYLKTYAHAYNKETVQRRVQYLIEQMALRGISHGDLHVENIIVTVTPTGRISGMWAIDFGRSYPIPVGKTELQFRVGHLRHNTLAPTDAILSPYKGGLVSVRGRSRANVNMLKVMYGKEVPLAWERRIANMRKEVMNEMKQYKSPRRSAPRARSLSLKRKSLSTSLKKKSAKPRSVG